MDTGVAAAYDTLDGVLAARVCGDPPIGPDRFSTTAGWRAGGGLTFTLGQALGGCAIDLAKVQEPIQVAQVQRLDEVLVKARGPRASLSDSWP